MIKNVGLYTSNSQHEMMGIKKLSSDQPDNIKQC